MRSAVRSRPAAWASPRSSASGGGNEACGDRFQVGEDRGDLVVGAAERAEHQHVRLAVRQHDPLPAARGDQRPRRKPLRRNRVREFGHG